MDGDAKLRVLRGERVARDNVVAHLRELLTKAEAGEVIAVASAWEYADGLVGYHVALSEGSFPAKLVGEVAVLQHSLIVTSCRVDAG